MFLAAAAAKSHQSCLTLCDPIDGSPPGSSVPGILQARTLEYPVSNCSIQYPVELPFPSLVHACMLSPLWPLKYSRSWAGPVKMR